MLHVVLQEDLLLLLRVLDDPALVPLDKECHEAPLHGEPDTARDVEDDGLDHQEYRDPLVVGVVQVGTVEILPRTRTLEEEKEFKRSVKKLSFLNI